MCEIAVTTRLGMRGGLSLSRLATLEFVGAGLVYPELRRTPPATASESVYECGFGIYAGVVVDTAILTFEMDENSFGKVVAHAEYAQ
jgi:hypothetical protein